MGHFTIQLKGLTKVIQLQVGITHHTDTSRSTVETWSERVTLTGTVNEALRQTVKLTRLCSRLS